MQLIRFIVLKPSAIVRSVFYRGICYGKLCGKTLMVYHLHIINLLMCLSLCCKYTGVPKQASNFLNFNIFRSTKSTKVNEVFSET